MGLWDGVQRDYTAENEKVQNCMINGPCSSVTGPLHISSWAHRPLNAYLRKPDFLKGVTVKAVTEMLIILQIQGNQQKKYSRSMNTVPR